MSPNDKILELGSANMRVPTERDIKLMLSRVDDLIEQAYENGQHGRPMDAGAKVLLETLKIEIAQFTCSK